MLFLAGLTLNNDLEILTNLETSFDFLLQLLHASEILTRQRLSSRHW